MKESKKEENFAISTELRELSRMVRHEYTLMKSTKESI